VEQSVKDWFLDWAALQTSRRGWGIVQTLRAAKELAPELFAHVHEDVPRKWKRSSARPLVESRGRGVFLSDAHMTVLSEIVGVVIAKVPVAAPVMREIFNQQLERLGAAPIKSNQWVCSFLAQCGHSWRRHSRFCAETHSLAQQIDLQQNVAQKFASCRPTAAFPTTASSASTRPRAACFPSATWDGAP
jgi:hypothetical protein